MASLAVKEMPNPGKPGFGLIIWSFDKALIIKRKGYVLMVHVSTVFTCIGVNLINLSRDNMGISSWYANFNLNGRRSVSCTCKS